MTKLCPFLVARDAQEERACLGPYCGIWNEVYNCCALRVVVNPEPDRPKIYVRPEEDNNA